MSQLKSNQPVILSARVILGLIYLVFGLNFFFHFIPGGGAPEGKAGAFMGGLFQSGYMFPFIKTIEVTAGALLLLRLYVPLVLVILMPISINILLFHLILAPAGMPIAIGLLIIVTQLYLAWQYRSYYKQLFVAKPAI